MRSMTKGILGVAAFAALALYGAAGCRHTEDANTIRFRYWGDTDEVTIIEGLVKDFEAANPGVIVKPERKPSDNTYADALLTEFASRTAPDVMFVSTDNIEVLAESNMLADLSPWLAKDPDLKAADYYDAMIKRFSKDGKLLVLPRDISPISCIYYNKDLFDKAKLPYPKDDWNWEDLRSDAIKLTHRDANGTAKQIGFADDWNLVDAWILAGGGQHMDDFTHPTRFTFAEGGALDGILFRYKLQQVDQAMPSSADNQAFNGGSMAMFLNGNLGMFHSGLWKTPGFRKIQSFKWDVAPFPRRAGVQPVYWSGGSGYTMRSDVANPELCWKLIRFMAGPDGEKRIAATGLAQPALKALANSPVFLDGQDPQNKKMLLYCAEHSLATPAWKPWVEFVDTMWRPKTDPMWIKGYDGDPTALIKSLQDEANAKFFPKK